MPNIITINLIYHIYIKGNYWKSVANRLENFTTFAKNMGFDPMVAENWYFITFFDIMSENKVFYFYYNIKIYFNIIYVYFIFLGNEYCDGNLWRIK